MTLYDLVFILLFLSALVSLLVAGGIALAGHRDRASRILKRLGISAACYMVIVYAVALASLGQVLALGEDQCSDDWCIAVVSARQLPAAGEHPYEVTFRLSSRARRVSQRERHVVAYLRGADGRRYDGEAGPTDPAFDVRLGPGETVLTHRRYYLPTGVSPRSVVLTRGGIPFPSCCIIGEATALLHPPTVQL